MIFDATTSNQCHTGGRGQWMNWPKHIIKKLYFKSTSSPISICKAVLNQKCLISSLNKHNIFHVISSTLMVYVNICSSVTVCQQATKGWENCRTFHAFGPFYRQKGKLVIEDGIVNVPATDTLFPCVQILSTDPENDSVSICRIFKQC